jgi:hypothetical protein
VTLASDEENAELQIQQLEHEFRVMKAMTGTNYIIKAQVYPFIFDLIDI